MTLLLAERKVAAAALNINLFTNKMSPDRPPTSEVQSIQLVLASTIPNKWDGPWMLLGDDFATLLKLRSQFGGDTKRLGSGEKLHSIAQEIGPQFVREIGAQSSLHGDSLDWWMTSLAGKNVLVSRFLLQLSYAEMFRREVTSLPANSARKSSGCETWLIVCGDIFTLDLIRGLAKELGCKYLMDARSKLAYITHALRIGARWIGRWGSGVAHALNRLLAAKWSRGQTKSSLSQVDVIIHSCVDQSCLLPDSSFRDRYFPGLATWLRQRGLRVFTIPWLYSVNSSWVTGYKILRQSSENFLILEDYMRLRDFPAAVWRVIKSGRWIGSNRRICSIDATPLILRERLESSSDAKAMLFQMYPSAIRRWIAKGGQVKTLIDMFENMGPERPLVWAFRRYSPSTQLLGYQHIGGIPVQQVSYTVTAEELRTGVFPDRIVANSRFTKKSLAQGGFPESMLAVGPPLRFKHLLSYKSGSKDPDSKSFASKELVLVLLPLELGAAMELAYFALSIAESLKQHGLRVVAKCHPMMRIQDLEQTLGSVRWPTAWEWGVDASERYFPKTLFVIAEGSSLLDAAAAEVPFVALHRELRPALNPLSHWWSDYPCTRNRDSNILREDLDNFIVECKQQSKERAQLARSILADLLPIDDNSLTVFLPPERSQDNNGKHSRPSTIQKGR